LFIVAIETEKILANRRWNIQPNFLFATGANYCNSLLNFYSMVCFPCWKLPPV